MTKWLIINRKIHLISSMVLFVFVLMYMISGLFMLKQEWFSRGEETVSSQVVEIITPVNGQSIKAYAAQLKSDYNIAGRIEETKELKNGRWQFKFYKPGEITKVLLSRDKSSLTIESRLNTSFFNKLNRLHHFRHYSGEPLYQIWAFFYDLSSIGFIVFAVTGMFLWFRRKKYRVAVAYFYLFPHSLLLA